MQYTYFLRLQKLCAIKMQALKIYVKNDWFVVVVFWKTDFLHFWCKTIYKSEYRKYDLEHEVQKIVFP